MLQLPWKKLAQLPEHVRYFGRIWIISVVIHLIGLLLLFTLRTDVTVHTVRVTTDGMHDRPIIVVPFVTSAMQKKNAAAARARAGARTSMGAAGKKTDKLQEKSSKTTIQQKKIVQTKTAKKEVAVPANKIEKKPEQQPVPKKVETVQSKVVDQKETKAHTIESVDAQPLYVGQAELEQYEIETIVHQAVEQHWCRPVGLASGVSCKMKVTIDQQGNVIDIQDEQSSGVLMFDSAVYMALERTRFPQRIAGKTISIIFS